LLFGCGGNLHSLVLHPEASKCLLNMIDVAIAAYGIKYFTYEPMKKGPNLRVWKNAF
jgi:hypothetical protein